MMKSNFVYWKDGFYEHPTPGAIEISEEYWMELLEGQSQGSVICQDENGYPILAQPGPHTTDQWREHVLALITAHDNSPAVNGFRLNGEQMWLDRETRVSLSRSLAFERQAGLTHSTIWYNDARPPVRFEMPIAAAETMLAQLEAYAKETFNVTQSHIAALYALTTAEQIAAYDYKAGYPQQLSFTL